jgi:hypothetical protein
MPTVLKSGGLSLLEPSGPIQACNGIAFFLSFFLSFFQGKTEIVLKNLAIDDIITRNSAGSDKGQVMQNKVA